jgi:hypothetical protein
MDVGRRGTDENYLDRIARRIESRIDPTLLPQDSVGLLRTYAVLALAVGDAVRKEDVHNAWVSWMLTVDPTHPSLVPYAKLDSRTARSDRPFVEAIRNVAREGIPEGD